MAVFCWNFLVTLVSLTFIAQYCECVTYNISVSADNEDCASNQLQCFSLSTLPDVINQNDTDDIITINFSPGVHTLTSDVSFLNKLNVSIISSNVSATIMCEPLAHFTFESTRYVSMSNVKLIGCGSNLFRNVSDLQFKSVTFEGKGSTGTSMVINNTVAEIVDCSFQHNHFGTLVNSVDSLNMLIENVTWLTVRHTRHNLRVGGAIFSINSNISVSHSRFLNNTATIGGDIFVKGGSISIANSTFTGGSVKPIVHEITFGGAIYSHRSNVMMSDCHCTLKSTSVGACILSSSSTFEVARTTFISNVVVDHGAGAFFYNSTARIRESHFEGNSAGGGAGVTTHLGVFTVEASTFLSNFARWHGAALDFDQDTPTVIRCRFEHNRANTFAGAVLFWFSEGEMYGGDTQDTQLETSNDSTYYEDCNLGVNLSSYGTVFINNTAPTGAALYVIRSTVKSYGTFRFTENSGTDAAVVYFLNSLILFEGAALINNNKGSVFAFNSNVTLSGCYTFVNGSPPLNTTANFREGGALSVYQSLLTFRGKALFENNSAEAGGAILSTDTEIFVDKDSSVYVTNNNASQDGGGLYLSQTQLLCFQDSNLAISDNTAVDGGGIHAISSSMKAMITGLKYYVNESESVEEYKGAQLNILRNTAQRGGGIYLEANSKITLLKDYIFDSNIDEKAINLTGNRAKYGGAIYVSDQSNSDSCDSNPFKANAPKSECFISVVSTQTAVTPNTNFSLSNLFFNKNVATVAGSTIFGGLVDRCIVSPFNERDRTIDERTNTLLNYDGSGLEYMLDIATGNTIQTMSSHPVRICPCFNGQMSCSYSVDVSTEVMKGHTFSVSLIAVDQVQRSVNATIQGLLRSTESNLVHGQMTRIGSICTSVNFTITSPHSNEDLTLFASDGPCQDAELSRLKIRVNFLPCSCPLGFEVYEIDGNCLCPCHSNISRFVRDCNSTTQTFIRGENVWIAYVNDTVNSGYLVHQYCPFDYCGPLGQVNLNLPSGSDQECAFNRTGVLCGACRYGLSVSLGSSQCLECPTYWPALFVIITVFAIIAGIGLVIIFLWLNITVAEGTLNGLLFYANIVSANRVVLLPYQQPNILTVFISWLNLELGIDVCYIEGMDTFTKTWLQLAFPAYIIVLVVILIVVSKYSMRFSMLIGKRNPVATLATLILISYGKLFHVVLLAQPFSFADLAYPSGSIEYLWLPDGTVGYLAGKHIVLFVIALVILLVCLVYSFLLLCWQLILLVQDWKIFRCFRSPTFLLFMEAYHVPYTPRHRYWTGLLLLARAVIYLIAATNVSGNPQNQLISVVIIMSGIILLKMIIARKIFKKWLIDSLESFFYFNTIFFASFTSYNLTTERSQDGIAYTSVLLSIIVTMFILVYHVYKYTPLHKVVNQSKVMKRFKSRRKERKDSYVTQPSITDDSDSRFDDIMDLAVYHFADSEEIRHSQIPTSSVVGIN